jgi:hypothetical protein
MAKTKISEFSATASSNTDIDGINLAEGMAPSLVNNAIRELMAQLKDQQVGTSGDNFTVGGNLAVTGTSAFTGNVAFSGTTNTIAGNLILGTDISSTLTFPGNLSLGTNTTSSLSLLGATINVPTAFVINSTGAVKIPTGTTAQRPTAAIGQLRYNSTLAILETYDGSTWTPVGGANGGGGAIFENANTVSANYTITTNKNGMSAGPITVASGVTVTVPSGSRWVIV